MPFLRIVYEVCIAPKTFRQTGFLQTGHESRDSRLFLPFMAGVYEVCSQAERVCFIPAGGDLGEEGEPECHPHPDPLPFEYTMKNDGRGKLVARHNFH